MSLVRTETNGAVAWLILDRPQKLNAFDKEMLRDFDIAMAELQADGGVRCIIVRGEGPAFSVGYDVAKDLSYGGTDRTRSIDDWEHLRSHLERWLGVWRAPTPVIAAVHGYCMGGATQLAVCCDLTVVATEATIGWPSLPMGGGFLGPVSAWLLGPKRAKELSFIAGSSMSGSQAADYGWANRAVPADDLLEHVAEVAERISRTSLQLLTLKKRAVNRVLDAQGFTETVMMAAEFDALAHDSDGCADIKGRIKQDGLRATLDWFNATASES